MSECRAFRHEADIWENYFFSGLFALLEICSALFTGLFQSSILSTGRMGCSKEFGLRIEAMAQESMTRVLPDGGKLLPVLSEKQADCLRFIYQYALRNRDYPLGTEIAGHLGVTKQAVTSVLNALVKKGYVFRDTTVSVRNLRLTQEAVEKMTREEGSTPDLFEAVRGH